MITKSKFFKKVVESLQKARKDDYKKQLPGDEHNDAVDFAASLPNANHSQWYLNAYKKDPSIHTPENKQAVHEFATHAHPALKALRFDKDDDFHSGLGKIESVKNEATQSFNKNNRISKNQDYYSTVHDMGDHAIVSAGDAYDMDEGIVMDHCGNQPASGDESQRLLSLRQKMVHPITKKPVMASKATLIAHHNKDGGFYLGEIKGPSNSKPGKDTHKHMVDFFINHPQVKGLVGGGYKPETNFQLEDLSDEHLSAIENARGVEFTQPFIQDLPKNLQGKAKRQDNAYLLRDKKQKNFIEDDDTTGSKKPNLSQNPHPELNREIKNYLIDNPNDHDFMNELHEKKFPILAGNIPAHIQKNVLENINDFENQHTVRNNLDKFDPKILHEATQKHIASGDWDAIGNFLSSDNLLPETQKLIASNHPDPENVSRYTNLSSPDAVDVMVNRMQGGGISEGRQADALLGNNSVKYLPQSIKAAAINRSYQASQLAASDVKLTDDEFNHLLDKQPDNLIMSNRDYTPEQLRQFFNKTGRMSAAHKLPEEDQIALVNGDPGKYGLGFARMRDIEKRPKLMQALMANPQHLGALLENSNNKTDQLLQLGLADRINESSPDQGDGSHIFENIGTRFKELPKETQDAVIDKVYKPGLSKFYDRWISDYADADQIKKIYQAVKKEEKNPEAHSAVGHILNRIPKRLFELKLQDPATPTDYIKRFTKSVNDNIAKTAQLELHKRKTEKSKKLISKKVKEIQSKPE